MALGANTQLINGQFVALPSRSAYSPTGFSPVVQTTPLSNVSIPPMVGNGYAGGGAVSGVDQVGGYGTASQNAAATQIANANPWNLRSSPVVWAVGGLVISVFAIWGIHWRKTTLAGAKEEAHVGPASESGEAGV